MNKLQMAHEMALAIQGTKLIHDMELVSDMAWKYVDAMQAEADKREVSIEETMKDHVHDYIYGRVCACGAVNGAEKEWQPDWSQAPSWANWWVIGYLTGQGVWSETKPVCVKFNGVNYWEVGSPVGEEHLSVAPSFNYQGNWQDSLRKRP